MQENPSQHSRFHELKAADQLPTATGIAVSLLQLAQREDLSVAGLAEVVGVDPSLSGRLLKAANALPVRSRPVVAVTEAIALLGLPAVRRIVLGASLLPASRANGCPAFRYEHYWLESLALGVALEALCARDRRHPAEEAYTFGLLAQVGRLALATVYPEAYAELLQRCPGSDGARLLAAERAAFLTDSLELTAALLADWGLPETYVNAVPGLTGPEAVDGGTEQARRLGQLLHLAKGMASLCAAEGAPCLELPPALVAAACAAGLEPREFRALFEEVLERWHARAGRLERASDLPAQAPEPARGGPEADRERLRVLVVDDDPGTRLLIAEILRSAGHEVIQAGDGEEGLRLALEHDAQLVVSDWLMPGMDGIELCRSLRSHRDGRRMYIILVTGQEDDHSLVEAFEAGADDYVTKPVRPHLLSARLRASERLIRLQREVDHERHENGRHLSELAVANRRLERAALSDPLTGLPNRRYATRRLEQLWSASRREDKSFACMLIDIDHFKSLNDTHGHLYGDSVLTEVATVLRSAARRDDEVCRIGGEEFLVVCANSDMVAATAAAERLRAAVESHCSSVQGVERRVTISIGVAVCRADGADPDDLLRAADNAVYSAKRLGRNRVCAVAEPAGPQMQAIAGAAG